MPDYRNMTYAELGEAYRAMFGSYFMIDFSEWGVDKSEEMIACLESGVPQDVETYEASLPLPPDGAVA